jgi:hypothetical protein
MHEEEVELLRRTKVKEELKRQDREGVLNIQTLVVKLPPHSSSSSKFAERKSYNEKIQFV